MKFIFKLILALSLVFAVGVEGQSQTAKVRRAKKQAEQRKEASKKSMEKDQEAKKKQHLKRQSKAVQESMKENQKNTDSYYRKKHREEWLQNLFHKKRNKPKKRK